MSNLDKFEDSYQVFEKNLGLCLMRKKSSKIHKKCLNNFSAQDFYHKHLMC
jgi:hypothetical protein